MKATLAYAALVTGLSLTGCASTVIEESPRTGYASMAGEAKEPELVWTSRTLDKSFDYLGQVTVRSWTYEGAVARLQEAGRSLRADAIIDVHYEKIGFLTSMQAFAIKYK